MHINPSGENYLETILILSKKLPVVRSVDIATELDFKKPSVSVAMKKLRTSGHIAGGCKIKCVSLRRESSKLTHFVSFTECDKITGKD